ncbi:MAG TPA: COX15/CtaA family protein [Anaerolineales bacterium]|nr:COX15/CtaA family protein [Anaerolineales bacterium]
MPQTKNRAVMNWLFTFAAIVAFLVVFGGFVRLTRSGLSIVEWNPISGSVPPIGEQAWAQEFAKYQQTPEFIYINSGMMLGEYKYIFYMEWIHRFIARLAGLVYAFPVFFFLFRKTIPWKEFGIYFVMGMLFIGQAFMGWFMVASGLVDEPAVDHFRLTIHLLLALTLLGLALWTAFGHRYGFPASNKPTKWSLLSKLALASFVILLIQISYGGLVAGLKAGHVSNTWPLMLGQWIPKGIFGADGFNWLNLFEVPQTVVYIHRWFAFLGMLAVPYVYFQARKRNYPPEIQRGLLWLVAAVTTQITLGVLVVLTNVNIPMASIHQAGAVMLFWLAIFFIHRLRALDYVRAT